MMKPYVLDDTFTIPEEIKKLSREELDRRIAILEKKAIFGVDLYEIGMAKSVCGYFKEMIEGPGAVRKVLKTALG